MGRKEKYNVAVVGATGAVGEEVRKILAERLFPVGTLRLLASERSAGQRLDFCGRQIPVEVLDEDSFDDIDIALFSAGSSVSARYAPAAVDAGAVVIDNTSCFRMDDDVPLVVPEVNADKIADHAHRGIIANPNCSTIQMVVALKPLYDAAGITRIVVSTYQSVSGAGRRAMEELGKQTAALFNGHEVEREQFPHQIAFNCIPHIDSFLPNGYTGEEMKMVRETRKILDDPEIRITATTVRVARLLQSLRIHQRRDPDQVVGGRCPRPPPGGSRVLVQDDPRPTTIRSPPTQRAKDATCVGRIREDDSVENGINLWVVADNLRKGAALTRCRSPRS